MALLTPQGIHVPSGLDYLLDEGTIGEDVTPDQYDWQTRTSPSSKQQGEEELLTTKTCVIWSQGGVVRKVFRFPEDQSIVQALLAQFPEDASEHQVDHFPEGTHISTNPTNVTQNSDGLSRDSGQRDDVFKHEDERRKLSSDSSRQPNARALVVILEYQAQIFFLDGAFYVVNLPFEAERAFATPKGIVLQRKLDPPQHHQAFPSIPVNPPASFFSTVTDLTDYAASHGAGSFGTPRHPSLTPTPTRPRFRNGLSVTDEQPVDHLPRLYSLTNPVGGVSPVVVLAHTAGEGSSPLLADHRFASVSSNQ